MSTTTLTWEAAVGVATGIPVGLLGVAGVQHVFGDGRRRMLGVVEIAVAGLGVVALVAPRVLVAAVVAFAILAVGFLGYLAWLWRVDRTRSCECTPFSTSVTKLSFVPGAALLGAALLGAGVSSAGVSNTSPGVQGVLLFAVSVLLGWAVLLWPPAAER